jgi:hypothetical protein
VIIFIATIVGVVIVYYHKSYFIVLFRRFFSRKVFIGSVAYFRTWSFYVERKIFMAYPGFEAGPPRSEVRRANHCDIGAPWKGSINNEPSSKALKRWWMKQKGLWSSFSEKLEKILTNVYSWKCSKRLSDIFNPIIFDRQLLLHFFYKHVSPHTQAALYKYYFVEI